MNMVFFYISESPPLKVQVLMYVRMYCWWQ